MALAAERGNLAEKEAMKDSSIIVNGREADILLYGEIVSGTCGDEEKCVDGGDAVAAIMGLSNRCDVIRVHINSVGGEVYSGIAIFNALRQCPKDVVLYTDGISASIAGIITMCGRRHYMSRYARLMIHSVSAGVYGDKNELKATMEEVKAMEDILAGIIAGRMGITPDEVKGRFFDGADHWFSAQEAVAAGLADGIYDLDAGAGTSGETTDEIYSRVINNRAAIRSQIINKEMEVTKFQQKPRFTNVVTEEDVLRTVDELNGQIDALEHENAELRQRLEDLERQDIEKILAAAVESGRIEESEKDDYRRLLNSDRASAEKVIGKMKPKRMVKNDLDGRGGTAPDDRGAWDRRQDEIRRNRAAGRNLR